RQAASIVPFSKNLKNETKKSTLTSYSYRYLFQLGRFSFTVMKLVFIYGPPASGKLTVVTELAKLTGFKLFHHHVSIQFVQSIFEFGTKTFRRLTGKYRLEMLEAAAKEGIDTIITLVYSEYHDADQCVQHVIQHVRARGGQVLFVRHYRERYGCAKRVWW